MKNKFSIEFKYLSHPESHDDSSEVYKQVLDLSPKHYLRPKGLQYISAVAPEISDTFLWANEVVSPVTRNPETWY